jgi:SAM-dependent methyltransferase
VPRDAAPRSGDRYLEPYRRALRDHGPGFEATLWSTRESQRTRFDVMIDFAGFEGCVVVDAGCGHGDFAERLLERSIEFRRFVGLDALPPVIEAARRRGFDPLRRRVGFEVLDLVASGAELARFEPDFVCFSGTLNTMDEPAARRLVQAAFTAAARGVVFNFLSDRCGPQWRQRDLSPARRFHTVAWLEWAMHLCPRVAFRQDYLDGHDATIMLLHGTRSDSTSLAAPGGDQ